MSGFIEGKNRHQSTLFLESLDEYVVEDSPARINEVFVEFLDMPGMGFETEAKALGLPLYHSETMLKLCFYGYLNKMQSSRRREREAQRNVEFMSLLKRLRPNFKTIADFRKDNPKAIRSVCKQIMLLCRKLDLLSDNLVAIDGSKFKAVKNRDNNFTKTKLERRLKMVDESINRYLEQIEQPTLQSLSASIVQY